MSNYSSKLTVAAPRNYPGRYNPVELDALPVRASGPDALHDHLKIGFGSENCAGCAQLLNDFAWMRFMKTVNVADWNNVAEPCPAVA